MRLLSLLSSSKALLARKPYRSKKQPPRLAVESLEERALLTSFSPLQIRHAYGFDRVAFEDATHSLVAGDGQGTTIAIVDAYDDPNVASDLAQFDSIYGLAAPPSFTKVNQSGGTISPTANRGWSGEIALDVEYAHAMAPGANILLVEANDASIDNLLAAVTYAAHQPGVVAVSMSWGGNEDSTETLLDSRFVTPSGHNGVTFLAASGDSGGVTSYPPASPNVVAVGGTSLYLNSQGDYLSESGWSGSGGGLSLYENQPAYQNGVVTQSSTRRAMPDVSFVANPSTGVMIYDTYGGRGLYTVGGTSAATPIMAGLTAIIDQGRAVFGRSSYSSTDFLNALYHLPQSDLHDIVTGNNGFAAGPGYDLVTGRGTPIVDRFVSAMIGAPVYNPLTGDLLITGGGSGSNDTITLSQSGGQFVVEISASTPVAGSSIPADQTFLFDSSQVRSVTIDTGDGSTSLTIDDSSDSSDQSNVVLSASGLTGLSLAPVYFDAGGVSVLTITGGQGNNTYTITGSPATQGTILNTGGGIDIVHVQGSSSPLTINSASGSGADLIILGGPSNTLSGIAAAVTVNAAVTDSLLLNDQGFAGSRTFLVSATGISWNGAILTYAGLGSITINGGSGGNWFDVLATSATAALTIVGGGNGDTLIGSDAGNTFSLAGSDTGTLSGSAYGSSVVFSQIGNLTAGSGGDTFQFADGASLSGNIVGGGSDTLDYSSYSTSVLVDLQTGSATGVGGSVSGIAIVFGGSGTPSAGPVFNLLIGKGGNTLNGGLGRRNILVAGPSASVLNGGDGEDLLIGGSTAYDTEAGLVSWQQLAAYWAGSDDFGTRVANLTSGIGVPLLDTSVVSGNGGNNILSGNGGLALLYTDGLDILTNFDPGSQQVRIAP